MAVSRLQQERGVVGCIGRMANSALGRQTFFPVTFRACNDAFRPFICHYRRKLRLGPSIHDVHVCKFLPLRLAYVWSTSAANVIKYEFLELPTNKWRGTLIRFFMQLDRSSCNSYSQGFENSDSGRLGTMILFGIRVANRIRVPRTLICG